MQKLLIEQQKDDELIRRLYQANVQRTAQIRSCLDALAHLKTMLPD